MRGFDAIILSIDQGTTGTRAIVYDSLGTQIACAYQAASIQEATALPVDAYFSATKIEWVLCNVSAAMEKARQGRLLFGTSDTWILWNLTGGKERRYSGCAIANRARLGSALPSGP